MAYSRVKIYVPDLNSPFTKGSYSYSNPTTKRDNIEMIKTIFNKYGQIIKVWSREFDIPPGVIIAFIATESGGKLNATSQVGCCFGLMQLSPNTIWDCARKWSSEVSVPLSTNAKNVLTSKVSDFFTSRSVQPSSSQRSRIVSALLTDANYSIMAGTLSLRWMIERFSTTLTGGQLNKAIVAYNAGAYLKTLQIPGTATTPNQVPIDSTNLVRSSIPSESRNYLYKMLGVDGFVALIYKDKVINTN